MPDGSPADQSPRAITISDSAVRRVRDLATAGEFAGMMLRVSVSGGGCSGFQYGLSFEDTRNADDRVVERDGVSVLIEEMSWDFVAGGEIENVYRLQIMNTTERTQRYQISVSGLHDIHIAREAEVEVAPASGRVLPLELRVHAEREHLTPGTYPIEFEVRAIGEGESRVKVEEKSVFIVR